MKEIKPVIDKFANHFAKFYVARNGGHCLADPDTDKKYIGVSDGMVYDQLASSTALFTVCIAPQRANKMSYRYQVVFTCKLFYNSERWGQRLDNYDLAISFLEHLKSEYRQTAFKVDGDYPYKEVTVSCRVDM